MPYAITNTCMHTLTHTHTFQNVVVVSQPSTLAHTTIVQPRPRANEYLILTLVLMVLCFIHGNLLAFFCLVPALICSYVVSIIVLQAIYTCPIEFTI